MVSGGGSLRYLAIEIALLDWDFEVLEPDGLVEEMRSLRTRLASV
jgi:hypothetical protein